jgi:hypothetical protein
VTGRWFVGLLVAGLVVKGAAAEPLRVLFEVDAEDVSGAPFPPGSAVGLELRPDAAPRLGWGKAGGAEVPDPTNATFVRDASGRAHLVLVLDPATSEVLELRASRLGVSLARSSVRELAGVEAEGLAYDAAGDRLYVLEASRGRLVWVDGFAHKAQRRSREVALPEGLPPLRGLAHDPATGHLHALAPASRELLELSPAGRLLAVRIVPGEVGGARALAFGPSSDPTDDPAKTHLFIAAESEGGGSTFELSLEPLALAAAATEVASLVLTVDTAAFVPPSPDPSGVDLIVPGGPLLVSDGEVEELSIFAGVNLYEVSTTDGRLVGTSSTTFFSDEPTGTAVNPANGHFFFSDDTGTKSVWEVTPGSDGRVNPGDPVRQIRTADFAGSGTDPEGVAFGGGALYVADGPSNDVYRLLPGANGTIDGGGDDLITSFDLGALGFSRVEAVAYDTDGGNLFVGGKPEDVVAHVTTAGQLLRWIDVSAGSQLEVSGLAYGPGPSGTRRLYVADRGIDGSSASAIDGKLYFFAISPLGGGGSNTPPSVSAGPDRSIDLSQAASLDGTVSDDGLPNPPGRVTTAWSRVSGPGTVSFANASAVDTTATFSSIGSYVLRLTASDGELQAQDEMTVSVTDGSGTSVIERRIATGTDDVEQQPSGSVSQTSSDLELVTDGSSVQVVGLRFQNLPVPAGATILAAWIQFQADEASAEATSLALQGQASDDAAPFLSTSGNVSSRPRTTASVAWEPPAWSSAGEAGAGQRTPDLSAVVQEIVNRPGWAPGHAMAFIVTGTGRRVAEAFEGTASGAPLLHLLIAGSAANLAPSVSAGPDRSIDLSQAASLDGTVSDDGLPNPPGSLTTTWSRVSGPGTVSFANASAVDTTATFSAAGSYVLRLTASDGALQAQDETSVAVTDASAGGTVDVRIAAGSDDAEERPGGSVNLTSGDLELVTDGASVQVVGLRFPGLMIPRGAPIQAAWIQFMADETSADATSLVIAGQASDNAGTFARTTANVSSRPRTSAEVAWAPAPWSLVGQAGADQRTPDLRAVVQEIVNRPGWGVGHAMAFLVSGSGRRVAESFNGKASGAPLLHVQFGATP